MENDMGRVVRTVSCGFAEGGQRMTVRLMEGGC